MASHYPPSRKTSNDPTYHPSRDTAHWAGDTTSTGQGVLLDQGEDPARQNLFGGNMARGREGNTSRLRPDVSSPPSRQGTIERQIEAVGSSRVPTTHWTRNAGPDIHITNDTEGYDAGGFYRHGSGAAPVIAAAPWSGGSTMIHEMGHAHHYATVPSEKERDNPSKIYKDTRGLAPDPLKEGVADAYVDRYGGPSLSPIARAQPSGSGKWDHISNQQFGYSSHYEENEGSKTWDDADRVLYAGARAHAGETGESPRYQWPPGGGTIGSSTDATIAMLHEHSPHAREAWSSLRIGPTQTVSGDVVKAPREFSDIADKAVRRHQDRRLLSEGQFVQPSLFGEPDMERNQLGEHPRSVKDVGDSLGVPVSQRELHEDKGVPLMELGAEFRSRVFETDTSGPKEGTAKNPQGRLFAPVGQYRGDPWKLHPKNWMQQSDKPAHDDIIAWHGSNTTSVPRYDSPHERQIDPTNTMDWNDGSYEDEDDMPDHSVDSKDRPMAEYGSAIGMHMGSVKAASVRGEKTGRVFLHPLRVPKNTVVDAPAGNFYAERPGNEVVAGTMKSNTRVRNAETGEDIPDNRWSDNAANYAEHATDLVEKGKTIPYRNDYEATGSTSYRTLPETTRTWSEDVQESVSPKYDQNRDTLGRPGEPGAFRGVPHPALQHLAGLGYNPVMSRHQRNPADIDPDKEGEHEKAYNAGRLWTMQKPNVLHDAQFRDDS